MQALSTNMVSRLCSSIKAAWQGFVILALALLLLLLPLGLASPGAAYGEWLQARSDSKRTGLVRGSSLVTEPQLKWRHHLGGSLSAGQFISTTFPTLRAGAPLVNSNSSQAKGRMATSGSHNDQGFIMAGASGLKSVRLDGALWWWNRDYFPSSIVGYFDLDGSGADELVTIGAFKESGNAGVFVHDSIDGALLWSTPVEHFGVGQIQVRVADLTGDGKPEVLVSAASLIGSMAGLPVRAYTFDGDSGGRLLWTIDTQSRDYYGSFYDLLVDWDGDGVLELVTQGRDYLYVYNARTGALVQVIDGGGKFSASRSLPLQADMDGDRMMELFFFSPGGFTSRNSSVRVAMFTMPAGGSGGLASATMVWQRAATDHDSAGIAFDHTSIADVRGAGTGAAGEVVFSIAENNEEPWQLEVRDGLSGQLLAMLPGHRFESAIDLDGDGKAEILTYEAGQSLKVFSYQPHEQQGSGGSGLPGQLVLRWDLGERILLKCPVHEERLMGSIRMEPCVFAAGVSGGDGDGDGQGVILGIPDGSGRILAMEQVSFNVESSEQPRILSSFKPIIGEEITSWNMDISSSTSTMGVVVSPGYLVLLDHALAPYNYRPSAEPPVMGVRIESLDHGYGGHIMAVAAANLDGAPGDELVAVTSNNKALALDVSGATFAGDGRRLFQIPGAHVAGVAIGTQGSRKVVVADASVISVYGADGVQEWARTVFNPDERLVRQGSLLMVDLDGDGVDEVVYQAVDLASNSYIMGALNLLDGGPLWGPLTMDTNSYGWRRLAALDVISPLDGPLGAVSPAISANSDLVTTAAAATATTMLAGGRVNGWWLFDGASGQPTYQSDVAAVGAHGVAVDVDGDGTDEYLAVNWTDLVVYGVDGGALTQFQPPGSTRYALGALVECGMGDPGSSPGAGSGGRKVLYVSPVSNSCSLFALDLEQQGTILWERFLSGGQVTASRAELDELGLSCMALGNVSAISRMGEESWPQHGPAALVGAADGFVYAIEGCSGEKIWSLAVDAPVREVIFADWTGDGAEEVVALSVDGYLTGIGQAAMESPEWVVDLDPEVSLTEDVEEIEAIDSLHAAWATVPEASGYFAAAYTLDGLMVTDGYLDMGLATTGTFSGLHLVQGVRYVVAVKAVGDKGESPPQLSNGVTVRLGDHEGDVGDGGSHGIDGDVEPSDCDAEADAVSLDGESLEGLGDNWYISESGCSCSITSQPVGHQSGAKFWSFAALAALVVLLIGVPYRLCRPNP